MLADDADEVVLETEMSNVPALRLYENLGFVRDKRLFRYYLNGVDALRLKLWFRWDCLYIFMNISYFAYIYVVNIIIIIYTSYIFYSNNILLYRGHLNVIDGSH